MSAADASGRLWWSWFGALVAVLFAAVVWVPHDQGPLRGHDEHRHMAAADAVAPRKPPWNLEEGKSLRDVAEGGATAEHKHQRKLLKAAWTGLRPNSTWPFRALEQKNAIDGTAVLMFLLGIGAWFVVVALNWYMIVKQDERKKRMDLEQQATFVSHSLDAVDRIAEEHEKAVQKNVNASEPAKNEPGVAPPQVATDSPSA